MSFFKWIGDNLGSWIDKIIESTSLSDTPLIRTIIAGILVTVGLLVLVIMWILINPTGNSLFL